MSFVWEQKSEEQKTKKAEKKISFSSYPPYLTVLNTSVQKHTGSDNEIYMLKVKSCKSGLGFPEFFWLMQIREGIVYLC